MKKRRDSSVINETKPGAPTGVTTVAQLISQGAARLENTSDSPTLDAEVLLGYVLGLNRTALVQQAQRPASDDVTEFFMRHIAARQRRIPIAYLTGRRAFMDFELGVTPYTLIPRPFTETLVERFLAQLVDDYQVIADIGTGSGAIALAVAKHAPRARVIATDVSVPALRVAAANARQLGLLRRVEWRIGSLLEPLRPDDQVTSIIANLPYLPTPDMSVPSIQYEPSIALHGGADGLNLIETLIRQLSRWPLISTVALELRPSQADLVAHWLRLKGFSIEPMGDGQSIRGLLAQK